MEKINRDSNVYELITHGGFRKRELTLLMAEQSVGRALREPKANSVVVTHYHQSYIENDTK